MENLETKPNQIPVAMQLILDCLVALGHRDLAKQGKCVFVSVNTNIFFSFNPTNEPLLDDNRVEVHPYSAVIYHDNFPIGTLGFDGGAIIGGQQAEDDFIVAMESYVNALNQGVAS